MQPLARRADARGELRLHEHVDIFGAHIYFERADLEVGKNAVEPGGDRRSVLRRKHAALAEHFRVRKAAADVLPVHTAVEPDGGIEIVRLPVEGLLEPARPHLIHGLLFLYKSV